jgi:hypothetical protein
MEGLFVKAEGKGISRNAESRNDSGGMMKKLSTLVLIAFFAVSFAAAQDAAATDAAPATDATAAPAPDATAAPALASAVFGQAATDH